MVFSSSFKQLCQNNIKAGEKRGGEKLSALLGHLFGAAIPAVR